MRQNSRLMRALYSFMQGRYGMDQLGRCTSCVSLGLIVAALLLRGAARGIPGSVLAYAAVALLMWG